VVVALGVVGAAGCGDDDGVAMDAALPPADAAGDARVPDAGRDAGAMDAAMMMMADAGDDAATAELDASDDATAALDAGLDAELSIDAGDDAGTAATDAGPAPSDAGPAPLDAGTDAGVPAVDAGRDAGISATDAGTDAGVPVADAGVDAALPDAGPVVWQYASSATADSFYPAGDCSETGDYTAARAVGTPDCTDCTDYCPTGVTGITPCSWFAATSTTQTITLTFATPITASEVRVWTTYTAPPGDISEVAVAATSAGPFTALTGGSPVVAACMSPRSADDYTVTFPVPASTTVGAVRITVTMYLTGIDAVGIH